jgi:hypothetical protein
MNLNLLPSWAIEAKKRRKRLKTMALVQAAVILTLAAIFIALNFWESRTWEASHRLSASLDAFDPLAEAAELAQLRASDEEFLLTLLPEAFPAAYLVEILAATPENATFARISYARNEIIITATTHDQHTIEIHRASLAQAFPATRLGRIRGDTENTYVYELHIFTGAAQ